LTLTSISVAIAVGVVAVFVVIVVAVVDVAVVGTAVAIPVSPPLSADESSFEDRQACFVHSRVYHNSERFRSQTAFLAFHAEAWSWAYFSRL